MVATTTFDQRHTLLGTGSFQNDEAVEKCGKGLVCNADFTSQSQLTSHLAGLPPGTKIVEGLPWGASAWTATYKVTTEQGDGSQKFYFVKTAKDRGAIMMEGEYKSLQSLGSASPGFVPRVYGWGKMEKSDTYFLVMDFIDLTMSLPNPAKFSQVLADMHKSSVSPTGKFGFPTPTCHGRHIQPNDWDESWNTYFTRLITIFFQIDLDVNGPWLQYEEAFKTLSTSVIPQLLNPLQAEGRVLKPCLVHGDLWEDNTGTDVNTGRFIVYDPSAMYAHNEYELGMWRRDEIRIGSAHIKQYLRRYPPSEPVEQWDDRNRLYSIKFKLAHSSGWPGLTETREQILEDMLFLIKKYSD
ncbi:hypothetical protein PG985_009393 [Apiospora marii]|uniref:uncharacterized protein n=1 Tax=Apiospora marii TaxID=335849 RepID=UPI003130CCE7